MYMPSRLFVFWQGAKYTVVKITRNKQIVGDFLQQTLNCGSLHIA